MRKLIVLVAVCAVGLAGCNQKHGDANAPKQEEHSGVVNVPLSSFASPIDPVCQMDLVEGSIADSASYESKLYGFCATGCKEEFQKNPQQYLSQK